MLRALIISIAIFCIIIPVSGTIVTYIPESGSISSLDVKDIAESNDGTILAFATTNGLSLFDSDWSTIQEEPWEYDTGLQDNFIQTLEFDTNNNLWLGFPAGVQIYDGTIFSRVGENEFFYKMDIHDILRYNDTIWIANGNSGLNHYIGERWEWIRPFTNNGPGAYYITSMAKDHATGNIILTSQLNGIWEGVPDEQGITFSKIPFDDKKYGKISKVLDYPFGGVILFNKNTILHYSESSGICPVMDTNDLGYGVTRMNDVALTDDGTYIIGTDNGLYGLCNNTITLHITRNMTGITNDEVTKVFFDSKGRWWFITRGEAGYYLTDDRTEIIPVIMVDEYRQNFPEISEASNPYQVQIHYTR